MSESAIESGDSPLTLLKKVYDHMEANMPRPHPDAPGHSHDISGHWDKDGTVCEWCETWRLVRKCVGGE